MFKKINDEVYVSETEVTTVRTTDINFLKDQARQNPRKRVRLCAHASAEDSLHEMLIVHAKGNYVPPHRHHGKSESFHMIEGSLKIVLFDDAGAIDRVIVMSADRADQAASMFYRLSAPQYHTVIPLTDWAVFHETTNGPFRREDMEFAPWAPAETAAPADQLAYIENLPI